METLKYIDESKLGVFMNLYVPQARPSTLLIFTFLLLIFILRLLKKPKSLKTILLVGGCGSGKTSFFYLLKTGGKKLRKVHTSVKQNEGEFGLHSHDSKKTLEKYLVVDIPGHASIRESLIKQYLRITNAIVLMIDSFEVSIVSGLSVNAQLLYWLITNKLIVEKGIPIFIVCNKFDIAFDTPKKIKDKIEKEIDQLRKTAALNVESQDESQDEEKLALVLDESEKFQFEKSPVKIYYNTCSLKTHSGLNDLIDNIVMTTK